MKIAGMLLLISGSTGMGIWMCQCMRQRIRYLEQMVWLFHFMESEVDYKKSGFVITFEEAARRMDGPVKQMLYHAAKRLKEKDACFTEIWNEEVIWLWKHSELKQEDIDSIRELGTDGYSDIRMQLMQIRMVREKLEETETKLKKEWAEKGKIYMCVGILSGMVVSIVLI